MEEKIEGPPPGQRWDWVLAVRNTRRSNLLTHRVYTYIVILNDSFIDKSLPSSAIYFLLNQTITSWYLTDTFTFSVRIRMARYV